MTTTIFKAGSEDELGELCDHLVLLAASCKMMVFSGELGSGKTTLIKHFCQRSGISDRVSSPSFSLVNQYQGKEGPVYHFDLYRIKSEEELFDIGYEDYFFSGYLCLIEWPEMAPDIIPEMHVSISISVVDHLRIITVIEPI